ncbi:Protein yipf4 [Balamuthia mandrillaris]
MQDSAPPKSTTIDLSQPPSTSTAQSTTSPDNLTFISLPPADSYEVAPASNSSAFGPDEGLRPRSRGGRSGFGDFSRTQQFLTGKGFGWLFEVEEDGEEEEEQLSLIEELDIDPYEILYKLRCVLFPLKFNRSILLSSPDFWGPMAVVLGYSLMILWGQFAVVSWVLTMWIFGSFLIFFLARVLGGDVSYAQTLGVIGYSLLPLLLTVVLLVLTSWVFGPEGFVLFVLIKMLGTVWSSFSASSLLTTDSLSKKQLMLAYPVFLLYIYFISLYSGV